MALSALLRVASALLPAALAAPAAAGGCSAPARVAPVLLQARLGLGRAGGRRAAVSGAGTDHQLELVAGMARDIAAEGRPPTQQEMDVFREINATLAETTVPGIAESHAADQSLLNNAADSLAQCNAQLESEYDNQLKADRDALLAITGEYTDLASTQATLLSTQSTKNAEMQTWLDNNPRPTWSVQSSGPSQALFDEAHAIEAWAKAYKERWIAKMAADNEVDANAANVTIKKVSLELKHCGYKRLFGLASFDHESCWRRAEADYQSVDKTVKERMSMLKANLSAARMIQCLVSALMLGLTNATVVAEAVRSCEQTAVDTSALDLDEPASVEKKSLAEYAVPESPVELPPCAAPTTTPAATTAAFSSEEVCTLAAGKPTDYNRVAGLHGVSEGTSDGITDGATWDGAWSKCVHTSDWKTDPYVYVDLEQTVRVSKVRISSGPGYTIGWSKGARIVVSDTPFSSPADFAAGRLCTVISDGFQTDSAWQPDYPCSEPVEGRYVGYLVPGDSKIVMFCEIEVCGFGPA